MRRVRQLTFIVFAAVYLVSCPLVLLQAFGYSLKPGTEQGIVKTGLISLATTPPGATVYLGKRRYTNTTPTILRGLLPGTYDVRIGLPGYQPWVRTVTVEAEKSAVFEHILLLPTAWRPERRLPGPFQELLPLPGTRWLVLRRGPMLSDHWFYDWKTGEVRRLVAPDSSLAEARVLSLWTVSGSPALLVRLGVPADEGVLWIEPSADEPRLEDLTGLLPPSARHVTWDPLDRRYLLFLQDGVLVRLHLPSKTVTLLLEGVQGFGLFDRTLYVLNDTGTLVQMDLEGKLRRPVIEPSTRTTAFGRPSIATRDGHPEPRRTGGREIAPRPADNAGRDGQDAVVRLASLAHHSPERGNAESRDAPSLGRRPRDPAPREPGRAIPSHSEGRASAEVPRASLDAARDTFDRRGTLSGVVVRQAHHDPERRRRIEGLPVGLHERVGEGRRASERRPLEITVFSKEALLLLGAHGELFTSYHGSPAPFQHVGTGSSRGTGFTPRAAEPLIDHGVLGLAWDPRHQRAAVWQKDRLGLIEWGEPPERKARVRWVLENSRRITQAFWVHESSHLLVHDDDEAKLLELTRNGVGTVQTLVPVRPGSAFAYDNDAGVLFYLEPSAGALCSMTLLHRRDLLSFSFQERTTSLGSSP